MQAHRTTHRRRLIVRSALVAPKTLRRCAPQSELPDGITFFHSAATCPHVRVALTPEPTKHEPRKRRVSERHVVGCCEELGRATGLPRLRMQKGSRLMQSHGDLVRYDLRHMPTHQSLDQMEVEP